MKILINRKTYLAIAVLLFWFALCLQFNVSLKLLNYDLLRTLNLYFCYFTVLTNIIAACCFTCIWLFYDTAPGRFFAKASSLTAITVYILVVAIIFNISIRPHVFPTGWARVADELLHVVNPLVFLLFWVFYVEKSALKYSDATAWLIYPIIYITFIVIRGYLTGHYPYHFVNVVEIGYPKAIVNAVFIIAIFWLLSLLLIFLGKKTLKGT